MEEHQFLSPAETVYSPRIGCIKKSIFTTKKKRVQFVGHAEVVELLANNGANLNIPSNVSYFTPLHYAVYRGILKLNSERFQPIVINYYCLLNIR